MNTDLGQGTKFSKFRSKYQLSMEIDKISPSIVILPNFPGFSRNFLLFVIWL